MRHEIDEDIITAAIGNDNTNASGLYACCRSILRLHAATPGRALLFLNILREVSARLHTPDEVR